MKIKNPPITVFVFGISLTPSQGSQTQNIPATTSVKESNVNSAAGILFDPIEYKIKPIHTNVPCVANNAWFFPEVKKFKSLKIIITAEKKQQNKPAIATVVNFGVSFLHLKDMEKTEKPIEDAIPKIKPVKVFLPVLSIDIIIIPKAATDIAIQTFTEIVSFKNKKPSNAVINGIAAKQSSVTAAEVLVIEYINVIIAIPSPTPPIAPEIPILV